MTAVILYFIAFVVSCILAYVEHAALLYICAGLCLGFAISLMFDLILDQIDS